jgi:histidine ammonia-lyase
MSDQAPVIRVGTNPLTVEDVLSLARGQATAALDDSPELLSRIEQSNQVLNKKLSAGFTIYGVSTGFGDSCTNKVSPELALQMPHNLLRYHGCGTGRIFAPEQATAVTAVRLAALGRGYSGARRVLLQRLCDFINRQIAPQIPEEGSVGASGDLTPLSYLAAALIGEREVFYRGQPMTAAEALKQAGLEPLNLGPKESLALMNGTSVMTALGCFVFEKSKRLARLSAAITALASDVMRGEAAHFDDRIFALKPHPGQRMAARWIAEQLDFVPGKTPHAVRVQDRYSIRCAPHVIGVLVDALPAARRTLEIELNSVNDNPIIDPDTGDILHSGNFYGGHVCFAMDGLKNAVANLADLHDRQLALMCNECFSNGLPANLVAVKGPEFAVHQGYKAMQITASALTAEALKLTMPASVFSRSTECHNQDKVSMGTIAARDAVRVLELAERVAVITLMACCQAVDIRGPESCRPRTQEIHAAVRRVSPVMMADRRLDLDIVKVVEAWNAGQLPVGEAGEP